MEIEMNGFASIRYDKVMYTGDLRAVVAHLDAHKIPDGIVVDWDRDQLWVEIANSSDGSVVEFIECGDHIPPDTHYDVVITTHTHAPEEPKRREPAQFDWMTIDRYQGVWEGLPE